jgi:hypothetical protein
METEGACGMVDTSFGVGAGKKEESIEMVEVGVGVGVGNMEGGCGKDYMRFENERRRMMVGDIVDCDGYCAGQNGLEDPNVVG